MHPILAQFRRLMLYLIGWIPIAILLAYLMAASSRITKTEAFVLSIPLCLAYAFVCLSAWYTCRVRPLGKLSLIRVSASHVVAALAAAGLWVLAARVFVVELSETSVFHGLDRRFTGAIPVIVGVGILLYMLSATSYYVYLAVLASRDAEERAIVAQVLARDAELKALKAQVNPHFLFNSLNSISALTTSDAPKAREMCILLGDFLRRTLGLGEKQSIPLDEEISLVHAYLAVEQIRFGARLRMEENIEKDALAIDVPPLLLQPLVENAVAHGIANLIEGGWIRLNIARQNGLLSIVVENQFDPDAPARRRNGVGLVNVRQRLETRYGKRASFDARADGECFRVIIAIPTDKEVALA